MRHSAADSVSATLTLLGTPKMINKQHNRETYIDLINHDSVTREDNINIGYPLKMDTNRATTSNWRTGGNEYWWYEFIEQSQRPGKKRNLGRTYSYSIHSTLRN